MIITVVGGQFGSEGKGAIAGHLAYAWLRQSDICIRVAGPNAGHTVYDRQGRKWALRQVPVAAVTSPSRLLIAPGSEIDVEVLLDEVGRLDEAGFEVSKRLWVHPAATLIAEKHRGRERAAGLVGRIGSTGKGIGAARADRIMREADLVGGITLRSPHNGGLIQMTEWDEYPWGLPIKTECRFLVEGTQGYGLGLHTSFYPKTTSSDCRAIDMLAMSGLPALDQSHRVVVVIRPYPIRVAGDSGPLWSETSWEALGLPEEQTTVTGKRRRVGGWDGELVQAAVRANGGRRVVRLALAMLDHAFPLAAGMTSMEQLFRVPGAKEYIEQIEKEVDAPIWAVGTGPETCIWGWNE